VGSCTSDIRRQDRVQVNHSAVHLTMPEACFLAPHTGNSDHVLDFTPYKIEDSTVCVAAKRPRRMCVVEVTRRPSSLWDIGYPGRTREVVLRSSPIRWLVGLIVAVGHRLLQIMERWEVLFSSRCGELVGFKVQLFQNADGIVTVLSMFLLRDGR